MSATTRSFSLLSTLGKLGDPDLCRIADAPEGMGMQHYRLTIGRSAKGRVPDPARISLHEDHPGIRLSSLIGNVMGHLIVQKSLAAVITRLCEGVEIEVFPFDLHDHRGRLYSRDYVIVNPIGTLDCLDLGASDAVRTPSGEIMLFRRMVLDGRKVATAPSLFRPREEPTSYVVDDRFARAVEEGKFTNVVLTPLEVTGG